VSVSVYRCVGISTKQPVHAATAEVLSDLQQCTAMGPPLGGSITHCTPSVRLSVPYDPLTHEGKAVESLNLMEMFLVVHVMADAVFRPKTQILRSPGHAKLACVPYCTNKGRCNL